MVFQSTEYSYACKGTTLLLSFRNAYTESIPFRSVPDAGNPRLLFAEQMHPGPADTDADGRQQGRVPLQTLCCLQ